MIMQLLVISSTTKNAGRWAARALLTSPATRRGAGYAIRPLLVATPFSSRFQSSAPDRDSQWMAATVQATDRIGDHIDTNHDDEEEDDDEDLDSILDSVLASDDDDDEEGAVRLQFDLLCLGSLPHRCTNLPSRICSPPLLFPVVFRMISPTRNFCPSPIPVGRDSAWIQK